MVNEKIRKAIDKYVEDNEIEEDVILLDNHAYDNSIVGITVTGHIVYDYNKMIEEFMQDENCVELDAIEWLEYNTLRALPYMGDRRPIILQESTETLLEKYAD